MFADLIVEAKENCQYASLCVECKTALFFIFFYVQVNTL